MFLTQCERCHCTEAHSAAVTSRQPGKRVQSGSTSSARWYGYGWPEWSSTMAAMDVSMLMGGSLDGDLAAFQSKRGTFYGCNNRLASNVRRTTSWSAGTPYRRR